MWYYATLRPCSHISRLEMFWRCIGDASRKKTLLPVSSLVEPIKITSQTTLGEKDDSSGLLYGSSRPRYGYVRLLAAVKMPPEKQDQFLLEMIEGRFGVEWNKHV